MKGQKMLDLLTHFRRVETGAAYGEPVDIGLGQGSLAKVRYLFDGVKYGAIFHVDIARFEEEFTPLLEAARVSAPAPLEGQVVRVSQ